MRSGGVFSLVIIVILAVVLVWAWALMTPAFAPAIDNTLNVTSGSEHGGLTGFFVRVFPWAVPLILFFGFILWGLGR